MIAIVKALLAMIRSLHVGASVIPRRWGCPPQSPAPGFGKKYWSLSGFLSFDPAWSRVGRQIIASSGPMLAILRSLGMFVADLFKSRCRLEGENLFLRHQLSIALRRAPPRLRLRGSDRALLVWLTRLWPSLLGAAKVVQPETIPSVASLRVQSLLALEIPKAGRAPED